MMNRKQSALVLAAAGLLVSSGCATTGRVRELESRVDALESRIDTVDKKADQAVETAEAADRNADSAMKLATDSARTSEAIFKKSVHK
jgi:outer membrane murein-binding lipoprotein Lpp